MEQKTFLIFVTNIEFESLNRTNDYFNAHTQTIVLKADYKCCFWSSNYSNTTKTKALPCIKLSQADLRIFCVCCLVYTSTKEKQE